jgi:MerR family copper efflux transcriptional regulator
MVKAFAETSPMLISEFARATGLTRDTVRFYVRRGLLKPLAGNKGGSNPYQVFTHEHVQTARAIRMAQSLGFSLREIGVLNVEYQARRITPARGAEVMRGQLARLEEKAAHVGGMISYIRAKLAWLEAGGNGPEPNFTDYERTPGVSGRAPQAKNGKASAIARRSFRKYAATDKALAK